MSKKTAKRPLAPKGEGSMLKMKELVEATGVAKSTILHYVNEGLLPKPVKTSPNMAYYAHKCIERIVFIKQLQSKHRLGLAQIKAILTERDKGREVTALIELKEVVFGRHDYENIDRVAFCQATGLSPEEVEEFLAEGLLIPKKEDSFDSEDVVIGKVLRQTIDIGIRPGDLAYYRRFAEKIVAKDMAIRKRLIKDQSFEDVIAITLELTRIARAFRAYVIDRIFQKGAAWQEYYLMKGKEGEQSDSN